MSSADEPIDLGGDDFLEPLPSPLQPEEFTIYALAYFVFPGGVEAGPFTITAQLNTNSTADELDEALTAAMNALQDQGGRGYGFGGAVSSYYVITSPAFFQYSLGV